MAEKCTCETDVCACCACVSMHCDECHKPTRSKFVQGRYCSNCGRPLKAELARNYVPKSEVDRLEYTLLGVMHSVDKWLDGDELKQDEVNRAITMREKTLRIIETLKSEVAREFIEIINDRIDNIRARIPYGGRAQGKTLAVEKMRLLESLKVEIAKKYTEDEG